MERRERMGRSEAALERLLRRIDDAIAEYSSARRAHDELPSDEDAADDWRDDWEAWWSLPYAIRSWLLGYVPGWWALAPGVFRRFLLTTAGLIVWNRVPPRLALRRAALRLRLPPPRPLTPTARRAAQSALRQFQAAARANIQSSRVRRTTDRSPAPRRSASLRAAGSTRTPGEPRRPRSSSFRGSLPPRRIGGGARTVRRLR
jgi:hypothetical protein